MDSEKSKSEDAKYMKPIAEASIKVGPEYQAIIPEFQG